MARQKGSKDKEQRKMLRYRTDEYREKMRLNAIKRAHKRILSFLKE